MSDTVFVIGPHLYGPEERPDPAVWRKFLVQRVCPVFRPVQNPDIVFPHVIWVFAPGELLRPKCGHGLLIAHPASVEQLLGTLRASPICCTGQGRFMEDHE